MALAGQGDELVTISEGGYGKRTTVKEYPRRVGADRGNPQADVSTGRLAGAFVGFKDQDVFVISTDGIVIRVSAGDIRRTGRPSQGVVMRFDGKTKVAAVAPVVTQVEGEPE